MFVLVLVYFLARFLPALANAEMEPFFCFELRVIGILETVVVDALQRAEKRPRMRDECVEFLVRDAFVSVVADTGRA